MSIATNLTTARRKRRSITFIWIAALAILVISLIYWEKTAILYILATLGVTALLAVVAMADLGGPQKGAPDSSTQDGPGSVANS